jgi:hypothetical protein
LMLILHDGYIEDSINLALNSGSISKPILAHATSHHHITTSKLYCFFYHLSLNSSPTFFQTHFLPSNPRWLILVSLNHITLFQFSRVHFLWLFAKSNHSF